MIRGKRIPLCDVTANSHWKEPMNPHSPRVLFESAGVLALWKPAGLATQAPPGIPSAESWVRQQLHGRSPTGYVGVPHRLDRGVSGVVLFAATPRAARKLSRQFERRQIVKVYRAIVECRAAAAATVDQLLQPTTNLADADGGSQCPDEPLTWRDFVEKIPDEARARIVTASEPGGREAVTRVRLIRRLPSDRMPAERLLLELSPVTGRMHQLRLQAAARGLPVVGDDLYGSGDEGWAVPHSPGEECDPADRDLRTRPIALHACRITYADPDTACAVTVDAPVPEFWPQTAR